MTGSTSTIPVKKKLTLSKKSEFIINLSLVIISSLLLIGFLEGIAYIWERDQANSLYAWELVASRRLVWEKFKPIPVGDIPL